MIKRTLTTLRLLVIAMVAFFGWSAAYAVETTGTLTGAVRDNSGTELEGIKVTVSSPALIGGERTTTTDKEGRFRFAGLAIGEYTIKAEHEGFQTAETKTRVTIGQEAQVFFKLQLPTAEETFTITDTRPVVDTENTQSGATFEEEFLSNIPSGRTYQDMAQFVPGVTGGGNPNVHGESLYSNSYLLDGVNITDPVTHTFSTNFNFDAIDAIEIITGGYDAEYGQATGAIINIVTKSGGNELTVDGSTYYSDYNFTSGGKKEAGDFRNANFNVNVGGPVIKDKLWFFTSWEYNDVRISPSERVNQLTGQTVAEPRIFQAHYLLGKLTYQLNPAHKLALQIQSDPTTIKNVGSNASTSNSLLFPRAQNLREQGGANYSLSHDWVINGNTLLRSQLAYVDGYLNEFSERRNFSTPGHINTAGESYTNPVDFYWDRRQRVVAHTKLTRFIDGFFGNHRVGAGLDFNADRYPVTTGFNGDAVYVDNGYQTDSSGNVVLDENGEPIGLPYLKYEVNGRVKSTTSGTVFGLWLQDEWKPVENLTLKVGGRFDKSDFYDDKGNSVLNALTFAPRLFAAWDPMNDQKSVFTLGYAQSYDNGSLLVPDFVKKQDIFGRVYQWDGAQYSYVQNYGTASGYELKKLRAPVKHEVQVSGTREIAQNLGIGLRLVFSRTQYYFEDDESNVIWNADGSDAIGFKNGTNEYIFSLGTPANSYRDYRGIEFTISKAFADGWFVDGSYTLGDATGTSEVPISYYGDNPVNDRQVNGGELSYNVANALKIQTTKELPMGFQVGLAYLFETGNPYDRIWYNNYYEDYYDYRDKPGQFHYDPFQRLDLRAQWGTKIGKKNRLTILADVFNVLDSRTVTERRTEYDPTLPDEHPDQPFGEVLDKQNPLNAQIGLRYNF